MCFFRRWLREEDGQDLIEYALLCAAIGFAGVVAFSFISTAMNSTYTSWDTAVQTDQLVEVPDPSPDTMMAVAVVDVADFVMPQLVTVVALAVGFVACVTDVQSRRIPNVLTFGAAAAAVVVHSVRRRFQRPGDFGRRLAAGSGFVPAVLRARRDGCR